MKPPRHDPDNERTIAPFSGRWQRLARRIEAFHLRDVWWRLLDFFEASRGARVALYLTAAAMVAGGALWFWAYPQWHRRNAVKIAREWLAAGQLRYAAEAAQQAAVADPENPEPWEIAAELARRGGQRDLALEYARRAAGLAPEDPAVVTRYAAAALRAGQDTEAERAIDRIPILEQAQSAHIQRLRGEIARRNARLTAACAYFEAAQRIEGPQAVNEVPLGLILLQSTNPAMRERGLVLLARWSADPDWGASALRNLLADAMQRDDRPAMTKWADALRAHPGCLLADIPDCLLALSRSDEPRYREVLATFEKNHAVTPQAAAQLLSWLNQIGRSADAVRWMKTLPVPAMQRPPLVVAAVEALRQTAAWADLQAWTARGGWGDDVDFLRWAYGLLAARRLGQEAPAGELWRTLYSHAQLNGAHGYFAGSSLYSWGLTTEAVALWWRVSEQEGSVAIDALGALARHYQVQRDAEGQYRVFRRLHVLRPQDPAIGNNFAFFATLTGREQRVAETVARANLALDPVNPGYLATRAFVLVQQHRAAEALQLLEPHLGETSRSPGMDFAHGLALAGLGRKDAARPLLQYLPPESLTLAEVGLIKAALGD